MSSDDIYLILFSIQQKTKWYHYFNKPEACNCDLVSFLWFPSKLRNLLLAKSQPFFFFFPHPRANFLACLGTAASTLCCQSVRKRAHIESLAPSHPGCWTLSLFHTQPLPGCTQKSSSDRKAHCIISELGRGANVSERDCQHTWGVDGTMKDFTMRTK